MAKTTICLGVVLMLLGILGFVSTGSHAPTALIPAIVGFILSILGLLALTDDAKKRMLYMHIAVTIGLLGFLFPGFMAAKDLIKAHSDQLPLAHPAAVHEQLLMAILCFIFVLLCVRSFITARRSGTV
jgi:hypothetical protein